MGFLVTVLVDIDSFARLHSNICKNGNAVKV